MRFTAQKQTVSTQSFTQIEDIVGNIVIMPGGSAFQVIEISATNFALQSTDEQQAKILSYASLLNSLSFPIEIVIISRKLDISAYVRLLEAEGKTTQNKKLSEHIGHYKEFVSDLVKNNVVLDKKFYIVVSFSFLEKGATNIKPTHNKDSFINDAKTMLFGKTQSLMQQLSRIGLTAEILEKNELIRLYYEIYNHDESEFNFVDSINTAIVQGKQK
jgi:hypothetical protein